MHSVHNLILIFLIAFLLDVLLGDPHSRFHPVVLFGNYARAVENFVRRQLGASVFSGLIAWFCAALPPAALAFLVTKYGGVVAAGIFLYFAIALRSLLDHSSAIRIPLENGDTESANRALD